eukprot:ANDGO_01568.mRNA.1 hypothetical protein
MDVESSAAYFEFTPQSFLDDVVNVCVDYLMSGLESLESHLAQSYPRRRVALSASVSHLQAHLETSFSAALDRFELYVTRNILAVPPPTVPSLPLPLPHAHVQAAVAVASSRKPALREEWTEKSRRLVLARARNAYLTAVRRIVKLVQSTMQDESFAAFLHLHLDEVGVSVSADVGVESPSNNSGDDENEKKKSRLGVDVIRSRVDQLVRAIAAATDTASIDRVLAIGTNLPTPANSNSNSNSNSHKTERDSEDREKRKPSAKKARIVVEPGVWSPAQ